MADITIVANDDAREYVAEHGGKVYVWIHESGLKHVATHPPDEATDWDTIEGEGITLYVDTEIQEPTSHWRVVVKHFPLKHVDAIWDGWEPGISNPGDDG
jgi:hypothetical protein